MLSRPFQEQKLSCKNICLNRTAKKKVRTGRRFAIAEADVAEA
jgi:hypothetical protein